MKSKLWQLLNASLVSLAVILLSQGFLLVGNIIGICSIPLYAILAYKDKRWDLLFVAAILLFFHILGLINYIAPVIQ